MAGSIWFGSGPRFQGGIVPTGGGSFDFLEAREENGKYIAFLPSCNVPFASWVIQDDCIEFHEVHYDLMLHAEENIRFRFGPGGEIETLAKGKVTCLICGNYLTPPICSSVEAGHGKQKESESQ